MNYIELINLFWYLDETWQFSCCETRLYFYLVKTANRLGWENSWTHSDEKTAANVGVSRNAMKTARNRLTQAKLISFKEGGKGFGNKTRYQILTPKLQPKLQPNLEPKVYPKVEPIINKLNKTKEEKYTKEILEKFKLFQKWLNENAKSVSKMEEPFTIDNYISIREKHSYEFMTNLILDMENWKPLLKKNKNAYLTFCKWADKNEKNDKN